MLLRTLLVLLFLSLPLTASADDASSATAASGVSQSSTDAATLGPAAGGTGTSSTAEGNALQPEGSSSLQSTSTDATGLTAPSSVLQAPTTSDSGTLQVLADGADGPQYDPNSTGSTTGWVGFTMLFTFIVASASLLLRRRPLFLIHMRTRVSKMSLRY